MKVLYVAFFVFCLSIVSYFVLNDTSSSPPEPIARDFLETVKRGDRQAAAQFFGDVGCSCPPKGGYSSYFKYESGLDPNLAFLIGKPYRIGTLGKLERKEKFPYLVPWERPVCFDVSVPLQFQNETAPLLLPLPMAFGKRMTEKELDSFIANPDADKSRGISLRLRSTVATGLVPQPPADKLNDRNKDDSYLFPRDAGPVITLAGIPVAYSVLDEKLPRLAALTVHLKMERRGQMNPWLISRIRFTDAVVQAKGRGLIKLTDGG